MSKTLEEIQAEISATSAALAGQASTGNAEATAVAASTAPIRAVDLGTALNENGRISDEGRAALAEQAPQQSVGELLQALASATGVPIDDLLRGLDKATGGTGEEAIILPEGTKTYYSNIANCGIMVQRGPAECERVEFKGDTLHTTDPVVIEYLDRIVDKPGSGIYSRSHRHVSREVEEMRNDLQRMAASHQAKMLAAGEKTA